jgi:peptidoglycan hydrolase-like protein with peptidoglycan-binding domain
MSSNNIINEEVSRMKSLFGYQRGKVISEQGLAGNPMTGQASGGQTYSNTNNKTSVDPQQQKRIANIGATYASVKNGVITQPGSQNGKKWVDYITDYSVSSADLAAAKELNKQNQAAQQTQNTRMQNIVSIINQIDPETATIKSNSKVLNGMSFNEYMTKYNVSQADIQQAKAYVANLSKTQPEQAQKATEVLNKVSSNPKSVQARAGGTTAKSKPEVMELQKQLKAAGYDLGTSGPNRDGVDGIMGPKTRAAQQLIQQKGQQALQNMSKQGNNVLNQFGKTIQKGSALSPEQEANANAIKSGQPLPQTKAPAAPTVTDQPPIEQGQFGEIRDGWQWNDKRQEWNKLQ